MMPSRGDYSGAREHLSLLQACCLWERFNLYLLPRIKVQMIFFFQLFWVKALEGVSLKAILVTLFSFCHVSELLDLKKKKTKLPGNKKGSNVIYAKQTKKERSEGIHSGWQIDLQRPRKGIKGTDKKFPNKKYQMPGMKNWGMELFSSWLLVLQDNNRASSWTTDRLLQHMHWLTHNAPLASLQAAACSPAMGH